MERRTDRSISTRLTLGVAMATLMVGCSSPQAQGPADGNAQPQANAPQANAPQDFANPVVKPAVSPLSTVKASVAPAGSGKVPGLVPQTDGKQRAATLVSGRPDPFSVLPATPVTVQLPAVPAAPVLAKVGAPAPNVKAAKAKSLPMRIPPLPAPSKLPISPLPPLAALPPVSPLPVPNLPAAPPISKTTTADAIQVTGVLQVQGQWHVIVKESATDVSRYVKVGERLSNGRVTVKKILATGGDPTVILQENGVEVTKSIGAVAQL
jgi:hypothetical protein